MNLLRLKIARHGNKVFAVDNALEQSYPVVNPGLIPLEMEDAIFSIDTTQRTAQFESRRAGPSYLWGTRAGIEDAPPTTVSTLPDGTKYLLLLNGAVTVTMKGEECYVDAPGLSEEMQNLVLAQALMGFNLESPAYAKALQYVILK